VSVLVVPDALEQPWPTGRDLRILVALDGTAASEAVLTVEVPLMSIEGTELLLQRVAVDGDVRHLRQARQYIDGVVDRVATGGRRVAGLAVLGDAAPMICAVARAQSAELIVLSAAPARSEPRGELGRVTDGVLRHARVPVLLIRRPRQNTC